MSLHYFIFIIFLLTSQVKPKYRGTSTRSELTRAGYITKVEDLGTGKKYVGKFDIKKSSTTFKFYFYVYNEDTFPSKGKRIYYQLERATEFLNVTKNTLFNFTKKVEYTKFASEGFFGQERTKKYAQISFMPEKTGETTIDPESIENILKEYTIKGDGFNFKILEYRQPGLTAIIMVVISWILIPIIFCTACKPLDRLYVKKGEENNQIHYLFAGLFFLGLGGVRILIQYYFMILLWLPVVVYLVFGFCGLSKRFFQSKVFNIFVTLSIAYTAILSIFVKYFPMIIGIPLIGICLDMIGNTKSDSRNRRLKMLGVAIYSLLPAFLSLYLSFYSVGNYNLNPIDKTGRFIWLGYTTGLIIFVGVIGVKIDNPEISEIQDEKDEARNNHRNNNHYVDNLGKGCNYLRSETAEINEKRRKKFEMKTTEKVKSNRPEDIETRHKPVVYVERNLKI